MKTYEQLSNAIMNGSSGGADASLSPAAGAAGATTRSSASSSRPSRQLCRFFFHSGYCRNHDACRFSHDANGMTREEALKTIPCPYFTSGTCRYGEFCELKHENIADAVCGICLENVYEKKRNFGILSCCNHTFCFSCLMEWRKEGSKEVTSRRVCPTCRKSSDYVVPSKVMPANDEKKEQVLLDYKAHCARIPCKHFELGKLGSCPFGRDCFYAHLSKKGKKDIKSKDKSMEQLYNERQRERHGRDRDLEYITDMILMMGLQRHLERRQRFLGESDEDDDGGDIFLSDILSALLEDDDDYEQELGSTGRASSRGV